MPKRGDSVPEGVAIPPFYARVDLVRDAFDDFLIMEVELIGPALYLRMDPGAPERFARTVDECFATGKCTWPRIWVVYRP